MRQHCPMGVIGDRTLGGRLAKQKRTEEQDFQEAFKLLLRRLKSERGQAAGLVKEGMQQVEQLGRPIAWRFALIGGEENLIAELLPRFEVRVALNFRKLGGGTLERDGKVADGCWFG